MHARSAACLVLLAAVARVVGGAVLLWLQSAPGWAISAWLMANINVRIGQPRRSTPPPMPHARKVAER
ncbi:MAG: hypothetical protein QOH16_3087 [Gaiellaceae bacterium]|nr:hypothetical protein [Gaiellaceae bacterium]